MRLDPHPFCWQCGKKLELRPKSGEPIFEIYKDAIGNEHRVHKVCMRNLKAYGWGNPNPYPGHDPVVEPDETLPVDKVFPR